MLLSKTADQLTNPKTVLAWMMGAMGAPVFLIGWLVPIRESLSMLPQFLMAGWIRSRAYRKPVWLHGASVQSGAVLLMVFIGVEVFLVRWGVGRSSFVWFCFLWGERFVPLLGRMSLVKRFLNLNEDGVNGMATSGAGLLTLFLGGMRASSSYERQKEPESLLLPLLIAFVCWLVGYLFFTRVSRKRPAKPNQANLEAIKWGTRSGF
jgi:hypothetical protein